VNYRTQLNFTWDGMKEARESLGRIDDWLERLRKVAGDKKGNTKIEMHSVTNSKTRSTTI